MKLKVGSEFETIFRKNPVAASRFIFKATRVGELRAPKVILCDDPAILEGRTARVRVTEIRKPESKARGFLRVSFLGHLDLAPSLGEQIWVPPSQARLLHAMLEKRLNVLLDGPQGCGKTVLARSIAELLGFQFVHVNCSTFYEPTDVMALLTLRAGPTGAPETIWMPTVIALALREAQANPTRTTLIFLDEWNRCRPAARNGIMPALDATRCIYDPVVGAMTPVPANVLWIAAVNTGAQFTGTTSLDPAQLDRFSVLKLSYLPPAEEERVLARRFPDVPRAVIARLVKAAHVVRTDKTLRADLSVRATEEVCTLLQHPNFVSAQDPLPELIQTSVCGRFQGRWDDAESEAGLVWQVVVRTLGL
jgi:MoxR-like ATPase